MREVKRTVLDYQTPCSRIAFMYLHPYLDGSILSRPMNGQDAQLRKGEKDVVMKRKGCSPKIVTRIVSAYNSSFPSHFRPRATRQTAMAELGVLTISPLLDLFSNIFSESDCQWSLVISTTQKFLVSGQRRTSREKAEGIKRKA
jgi:hypothetical protein